MRMGSNPFPPFSGYSGGAGGGSSGPSAPIEDTYANVVTGLAAANAGTAGIPNNDLDAYLIRGAATTYQFFRGMQVTPPTFTAWQNQNGASVNTVLLGEIMSVPTGNDNAQRYQAWAVSAGRYGIVGVHGVASIGGAGAQWGMVVRDTVAGRFIGVYIGRAGGGIRLVIERRTDPNAFGAGVYTGAAGDGLVGQTGSGPIYIVCEDDGANLSFGFRTSPTEATNVIYSETRAAWLTNGPNQLGFVGCNAPGSNGPTVVRCFHAEQG